MRRVPLDLLFSPRNLCAEVARIICGVRRPSSTRHSLRPAEIIGCFSPLISPLLSLILRRGRLIRGQTTYMPPPPLLFGMQIIRSRQKVDLSMSSCVNNVSKAMACCKTTHSQRAAHWHSQNPPPSIVMHRASG